MLIFTNFFWKCAAYLLFLRLFLSNVSLIFSLFLTFISSIFIEEVLSHGGKKLERHPELEIKPVMPSPAPPDLSDQWKFYF